jgi:hypothetical protein
MELHLLFTIIIVIDKYFQKIRLLPQFLLFKKYCSTVPIVTV